MKVTVLRTYTYRNSEHSLWTKNNFISDRIKTMRLFSKLKCVYTLVRCLKWRLFWSICYWLLWVTNMEKTVNECKIIKKYYKNIWHFLPPGYCAHYISHSNYHMSVIIATISFLLLYSSRFLNSKFTCFCLFGLLFQATYSSNWEYLYYDHSVFS